MQHKDRRKLIETMIDTFSRVGVEQAETDSRACCAGRLDLLLDEFLLERQPITASEVSILMADLRGFTAISEAHSADVVIEMLNRYFSRMCSIIAAHGGMVDKFMGDSVMALFGAQEPREDHLHRALACAVRMQQAMVDLNRTNAEHGQPRLYAGIGVNSGRVMAGSFGSNIYSEYTVIGEPVNLAARIVAYSLRGQILVSDDVRSRAAAFIETGSCNQVRVKGKPTFVALHEVTAINDGGRLLVPPVDERRSPRIRVDLPLVFHRVQGKHVSPTLHRGRVLDLGYEGMRAQLPLHLDTYSEIVMTLTPDLTAGEGAGAELYAKVLHSQQQSGGYVSSLEFTSMDTSGQRAVKQYVDQSLWGY